MRTFACGLAALSLLAGCSMPYHPPKFVEPEARFPGLIDFVAGAGKKQADVLLVHGMCTHDATWATDSVATLAAQLAANVTAPATRSSSSGIVVIPATIDTPQGKLFVKSLIWSPLTTPIKQQLCYDQTGKSAICTGAPPFPATRASINAQVKDLLLDDCLPDALIYQGTARQEIQQRMRAAILSATAGADPNAPLVVISESLGSKILFDTLLAMIDERTTPAALAAQRDLARMAYLIMAANQIPLLQTAEQALPPETGLAMQAVPPDSLVRLLELRRGQTKDNRRAAIGELTLIAFTDPNDLLSYTLPPERYRAQGAVVHNVLVSNARTYFGWFENPLQAHLGYLANPDVGSLISCGVPRSGLCK